MGSRTDDAQTARTISEILTGKGIKLLAIDFDRTIVTVHTHGAWHRGASSLAEYVRPCFKALLSAALEPHSGLHVCVVTYSMQPDLITEVLKIALPKSDVSKVMIRASTKDWAKEPGITMLGKQQHIASVVTELYNKHHMMIKPQEILLLDDDLENVKVAVEFGHKGFEIKDNVSLESLRAFSRNC